MVDFEFLDTPPGKGRHRKAKKMRDQLTAVEELIAAMVAESPKYLKMSRQELLAELERRKRNDGDVR
jgi:hypothetical protein